MHADLPFQERNGKTILPNDQKPETISRLYHYDQVDVDPRSVNLSFNGFVDVLTYLFFLVKYTFSNKALVESLFLNSHYHYHFVYRTFLSIHQESYLRFYIV